MIDRLVSALTLLLCTTQVTGQTSAAPATPAAAVLAPQAAASAPPNALPLVVRQALERAGLPTDALAVMVATTGRNSPRLLHRVDEPMQPGSTMKLVTSVVALDRLGPNHRGRTELLTSAAQENDVLQGDLVLRGGADPELGLPQLWALLNELRWQGIREIAGDMLLDRTLFRPQRLDIGQPPFDEAPEFGYNVIPDALFISGNLMGLELRSDKAGVQARALPPLAGILLDTAGVALGDKPCKDWDDDWRAPRVQQVDGFISIALQGAFPRDCVRRVDMQLIDRTALAERQLRWLWEGLGGTWRGTAREAATPSGARLLASRVSRPWGETLRGMNKRSDNALTRLLYLSLGADAQSKRADAPAHTADAAAAEVQRWMREQKIDASSLVLDNGSGLSRTERLSARLLVEMLQAVQAGAMAPELMMSLPLAGVDGTLRNRMKSGPAFGRARLKTGTLRNVTALAGYVPDGQGRLWSVAAIINHPQAGAGRPALDALIQWVAQGGPAQREPPPKPPAKPKPPRR